MNKQRTFSRLLLLSLLSVSLLLPGCATLQSTAPIISQPVSCISTGWPHDASDLKPDPALVFGVLENGLRYVVMPNHEPKGRVGMYLNIQAGSLHETDEQRGLAHYLEHMLFNGTTHYPPGTLIDYFQSIGMGFGADTNAHTSYDETVYKLMLPAVDRKTLGDGLLVLADYARGALLLEKEVDKERGIIQAEKLSRDSARRRVRKERMKFVFDGTMIAERDIIGADAVLNTADSALLRQYYDTWYRPDNMIVVIVGDADTGLIEELIKENFDQLSAAIKTVDCPDFGRVPEDGIDAFYLHEHDLGYTNVAIESLWNVAPRTATVKGEAKMLKEYVGAKMLNNRLQQLVNTEGSPMTRASFYSGTLMQRLENSSIDARTSAEHWQQTLNLLHLTLRQPLQYGFSEPELARAKQEILTMLKKQVQVAASRESKKLASGIIRSLNKNEVYMSPDQEMALYQPLLEKMTLAEVNEAYRGLWQDRLLVQLTGAADLTGMESAPESIILQAWQESTQAEVTAWVQEQAVAFPYLPIPEQVAAVEQHIGFDEIGVDRYLFANGLILNLKKTDFQPNEISVAVALGNGRLSEPVPGLGTLADQVVAESGLGGLTKDQLAAALAPYSSRVHFRVGENSFNFTGKGLTSESELLFQLLFSHIEDPAFRADAFHRSMEKLDQMYAQMIGSVEGMMQLTGERFLAGGNHRYGIVPHAAIKRMTLEQIENWLRPELANAGLEISVVGDFDRERILNLVGLYFGGQRDRSMEVASGDRISFPSGQNMTSMVPTETDKALFVVAWPTDDFWDISRTRRLNVLAEVLGDRLRKEIREDMGATYSPVVYNRSSRVDPGYGVLRSRMLVAPDQAELLIDKVKEAGAELAKTGATEKELERALEPTLTSIRDMVRTNRYWLGSVLTLSSRYPQQLEWPLTLQDDFASITAEDISDLAAKYLQSGKAAEIMLLPEAK